MIKIEKNQQNIKYEFFSSKASPKQEKPKPKKLQAPSNANKMDTNGLDYTKKTDAGKPVRIINDFRIVSKIFGFFFLKENGRPTTTAPIAARPEQGDLKTMAVEYD